MTAKIAKKDKPAQSRSKFITRNQALKKLQLPLSDFRRLCILKGIFPRDPKSKRKSVKGATSSTTFYHTKDIQFLAHEPLLNKFREQRVFERKLRKFMGRGEAIRAKSLERPQISLDHLVRERYPQFVDALRDLDDALSLVALFAMLPASPQVGSKDGGLRAEVAADCARLLGEWEAAMIGQGAIKKSFISIKGIYWQAELFGLPITWVQPHQFATELPTDVDFRVMLTFLDFYRTLLSFVNFRLFSRLGWAYPLPAADCWDESHRLLLSKVPVATEGRLLATVRLFIGREVPLAPVALLAQSLGATVGWAHNEASPFGEDDPSITHQLVDRPALARMLADRVYVQPQWLFDSLNAASILDPEAYRVGQTLPPHLSPFVLEQEEADQLEDEEEQADQAQVEAKREAKKMAVAMLPKKRQKLYNQMQHSRRKQAEAKAQLTAKKNKAA